MEVTFTAKDYRPDAVRRRYVRANSVGGDYSWYEVGEDPRFDLRQGLAKEEDLPRHIRQAADKLRRTWPGCVDWPIDNKE